MEKISDALLVPPQALAGNDFFLVIPPPLFTRMPSCGGAYLITYLKSRGFKAGIFDFSVLLHNKASQEVRRLWQMDYTNSFFVTEIADKLFEAFRAEIGQFVEEVLNSSVKVIGFSVNQISIFLANMIAERIKEKDPSRVIVFGGPATFFKHPRELITPGFVDYFVIGEGEEVLGSLLERIFKGQKIGRQPGLLLGNDMGRVTPVPPASIRDLDSLPFPTYEEFDLSAYNDGLDYKPLPLLTSRGCIKRCAYCIDHIMWPAYRVRSAAHIFHEIEYHCRVNKTRAFEFNDLLCNGNLRVLSALCDLIIPSGLKFDWVSYAIIRRDMNPELLAKMHKAGCHTIIYGMEHSSPRVLKGMNKDFSAAEAEKVVRMTKESGICTNVNIIVGFPGETQEDFDQVVAFLRRNHDYIDEVTNISACTLFPEAALGRHKEWFGIQWKEGVDPMTFRDANGMDRQARNARVAQMQAIVEEMGLRKSIVNRPKLNPLVKE